MLEHINLLKNALIQEFQPLFQQYKNDGIYACTLVFNSYMHIECAAVSTSRSIYAEEEDRAQYLAAQDRWNIQKWRYTSPLKKNSVLNRYRYALNDLAESKNSFSYSQTETAPHKTENQLQTLLDAFKQVKTVLMELYPQPSGQILFFIGLPAQPEIEIHSAHYLNPQSSLLESFINDREPKLQAVLHLKRFKLSQSDKDLLIDLAQLAEMDPYDELHMAHAAYLLTLEASFAETNLYIQRLIHAIAAMATGSKDSCAMQKYEIIERINQFYHASSYSTQPAC
ncbi:DUF4303 domain-containing protein [Acinetobacter sp. ANC 3813]|uniref:DUF4303 domain-containing protein n=1 Tax=Acinetobacter sp. ANC 3813 TaxID=1977873 RepID=UPI000A32F346|nr:DUF4303 domain-containing protein [Acinetobacter sp. ANC 3813]OTG89316.1 hypothetical protein B9T34_11600 [Acinetobacter sp. ANC 3813]